MLAASIYPGLSYTAQQVSELPAIGASTRALRVAMVYLWAPPVGAFAIGVWLSAGPKRSLRVTGILLVVYGIIGVLRTLFALVQPR